MSECMVTRYGLVEEPMTQKFTKTFKVELDKIKVQMSDLYGEWAVEESK